MRLISGRPISSNPASEESFGLAKAWIDDCLNSKEHSYCPKLSQPCISTPFQQFPKLPVELRPPTRLIDVGPSTGFQEPKLILSSDSQVPINPSFVALSHCWGQTQLLR